jgi:serpin B
MALAMTSEGAQGKTFDQLQHAIQLPNRKTIRQWSSNYIRSQKNENTPLPSNVNKNNSCQVSIANRLYANDKFIVRPEFSQILSKFYESPLESINFAQPQLAADHINSWVANKTNNKIPTVLSANDIDPILTRLILVNALHFKGPWAFPFDSNQTIPDNFTLSSGNNVLVPSMHLVEHFAYLKQNNAQWINLPYSSQNGRYVMTLALPDDTLTGLEQRLVSGKELANIFTQLDTNDEVDHPRIHLSMPKFRIESTLDFITELKSYYNVTLPFDAQKADFSLMSTNKEPLYITKIVHKAMIDVNEAGTEAAAVTAVIVGTRSMPRRPFPLKFDRPFLFFLRDRQAQVPLFIGRYTGHD